MLKEAKKLLNDMRLDNQERVKRQKINQARIEHLETLESLRQQYHETLLLYHNWPEFEIVPHMSGLVNQLPSSVRGR